MIAVPCPKIQDFSELDELTLLACLIAGEARGESFDGKIAVGYVVRARVESGYKEWFGDGYHGVILKPFQFSCFNSSDPNCTKLLSPADSFGPEVWRYCFKAASAVYFGFLPDPTLGADHYHTLKVNPRWDDLCVPSTDNLPGRCELTVTIGNHSFFRLRP